MKNIKAVSSVYFGANGSRVGGYNFLDNQGNKGMADFVSWEELVKLSKSSGIKWVHLAGDWQKAEFKKYGYKGYGQRVPLSKIVKILSSDELIQYRKSR